MKISLQIVFVNFFFIVYLFTIDSIPVLFLFVTLFVFHFFCSFSIIISSSFMTTSVFLISTSQLFFTIFVSLIIEIYPSNFIQKLCNLTYWFNIPIKKKKPSELRRIYYTINLILNCIKLRRLSSRQSGAVWHNATQYSQ